MAILVYGPVTFGFGGLLSTIKYHRHPILEGGNYSRTTFIFEVEGYVNPASISYAPTAGTPNAPILAPGLAPVLTDTAIRHMLAQPRQQLIYVSGGAITVISPLPGFTVDAAFGPVCTVHLVTPSLGEFKTWLVRVTIETEINECALPGVGEILTRAAMAAAVVTSNVWSMHHSVSCDGLSTIVWDGRTTLRSDLLLAAGLRADDLRPFILPGLPPANCRRDSVEVRQLETPDRYQWRIVDQELMWNLRCQGATRAKLSMVAEVTTPDFTRVFWEMANITADWLGRSILEAARDTAIAGSNVDPIQAGIVAGAADLAVIAGTALRSGAAVSRYIQSNIPTVVLGINVGIWGRRDCSTKTLERFALALANARFTQAISSLGTRLLAGQTCRIVHDLAEDRYVGLEATVRTTVDGLYYALPGISLGGIVDLGSYFADSDDTVVAGMSNNGLFTETMPGLGLVNDRGTRGSLLQNMIYAVLATPCSGTLPPPALPNATPSTVVIGPNETVFQSSLRPVAMPPVVSPVNSISPGVVNGIIQGVLAGAGL